MPASSLSGLPRPLTGDQVVLSRLAVVLTLFVSLLRVIMFVYNDVCRWLWDHAKNSPGGSTLQLVAEQGLCLVGPTKDLSHC